jgi:hypothetical protein
MRLTDDAALLWERTLGFDAEGEMNFYILCNKMTQEIDCYPSREAATDAALAKNCADSCHPSFALWYFDGLRTEFIGDLRRKFGDDFNPIDCWRKRGEIA